MKESSYYPSQDPLLKLKQEMKLRGFSQKTIKSYIYYITDILEFAKKNPKTINSKDIRSYLEKLANKGMSASTLNSAYSALKFYFEKILKRKFFGSIPRSKKIKQLPVVLTKNEIKKILSSVKNVKHKLILAAIYSSGLRVSEVVQIKVSDLDIENKMLFLREAKGKKDRTTIISKKVLEVLKKYIKNKKPDNYLFESSRGGKMTERSIQKIFSQALKTSKIKKQASCHSLRHSFATHLLEDGTDIRYIQSLLGHKRLETTQIYTKVANNIIKNIKSPLD